MQEIKDDDPIGRLRADKRKEISVLRKKDREEVLRRRRMKLTEVEALVATVTLEQFKELVLKMKLKKPSLDLLKAIKNSCHSSAYIEAFFKTNGAFSALIRILVGKDAHLQLESAAILTNLACGSHKASCRIAREAGAYLVSFITGGSVYLQDQSAWAAGNIANDCLECFSLLKSQGILPALVLGLQSNFSDVLQSATYALHACSKYGDDPNVIELATSETFDLLFELIKQEDVSCNTRSDAAFTLANLCYSLVHNNADVDPKVVTSIVGLLQSVSKQDTDALIALPLLRCLGFLSTYDSISDQLAQDRVFYPIVTTVIDHEALKKEKLWVLTNIAANKSVGTADITVVHDIIDFLSPVDSSVLQTLYFLCTLVVQNEHLKPLLQEIDVLPKVNTLSTCGDKEIENACKCFQNLML